jgi:hypothetical protein
MTTTQKTLALGTTALVDLRSTGRPGPAWRGAAPTNDHGHLALPVLRLRVGSPLRLMRTVRRAAPAAGSAGLAQHLVALGANLVLSIPLQAHLSGPAYGQAALPRLQTQVAASGLSREQWDERFNQRQQVLSKASVLAMVPVLALAAAAL